MDFVDKFHNWRRKMRWDKQYRKGRWDSLKSNKELSRYSTIVGYLTILSKPNPSILDLGSGEGVLNEKIPHVDYSYFMGVDYSKVSIDKAKEKNFENADFVCADLHTFSPGRKFDVIVFNEVFYYIHDSEKANVLNRMIDHLEDDGIIITSIYRESPGTWKYFDILEKINFVTVKTEEETRFWQIGVFSKKDAVIA